MRKLRARVWFLVLCLCIAAPVWSAGGQNRPQQKRPTLDDLSHKVTTQTQPDGTTLRKRAFKSAIPWDEYQAALSAEEFDEEMMAVRDAASTMALTQCLAPADGDFDGDGFTMSTSPADTFPLRRGEYVADRPRLVGEFTSRIEPSVQVLYQGEVNYTTETETFLRDDLVEKTSVKDTLEIRRTFNGSGGLKLNFGWSGGKPTFGINLDASAGYEVEKKRTYAWSREKTRETEQRFSILRKRKEDNTLTIQPNAGRVYGQVEIRNESDYAIDLQVSNVRVAVVAYSPFTGLKDALGDIVVSGPFNLYFGLGNNFYRTFLEITGLNTLDMMNRLAEGWVFDMEIASAYSATELGTNRDVGALISQINQRNARLSIHYGDNTERNFGQVSVFAPGDTCLTAKEMVTTYVGAANVEFDRIADGTPIVKRINHRANRHADRDFDSLSPAEQTEYGRWIVGFDFYSQPLTQLDIETTALAPEDRIFLYYLTAADFRDDPGPADIASAFTIANNGSAPASAVPVNAVSTNDIVEITVANTFQIEEAYTQSVGNVWTSCGAIYGATYRGRRVVTDSLNNSITIPNADYYGLQMKLGGMPWLTVAQVMADPTVKAQLTTFRGFPYYDYVLRFTASPTLMGNYPTRNLQVQNVKPRQSFTVGYEGFDLLGRRVTCYSTQTGGFFRNSGTARVWYKLDNIDDDADTFYNVARTGIDFDDANPRRFPYSPEHLDGLDNDGDAAIDENPLRCPVSLSSYQDGTCTLDNRMGWYGATPNIVFERRWRTVAGTPTPWESVGSGITSYTFTMTGNTNYAWMDVRATYYPVTGGSFAGISSIIHAPGGQIPLFAVGQEIEAEAGALVLPMRTGVSGLNTYIHTPAGSTDFASASAEYRVQVTQTGDYELWSRVFATGASDDSFLVTLRNPAGAPVDFGFGSSAHFRFEFCNPSYVYGTFSWTRVGHYNAYVTPVQNLNPITWRLNPGIYTIQFMPRELGTRLDRLRLDRICRDNDADGWSTCQGDCNDNNANIHPGRGESCSNNIDDDCDGYVNEGCSGGGSPIFIKKLPMEML